ncbi:B12-binding domain-containing radical SAM protein [Paenibacillus massiliensis]|uniref:B12-binding domain-containing radical SAM protein n=1 Tax=Paenibacillus massiliensis TaxID=225917 RepID=UPI00037B2184|nr:radical SAM protein [Paenibacillus massiliensis]
MNTEPYVSVADVLHTIKNGNDEELRNLAWKIGMFLSDLDLEEKRTMLNAFLDRIATVSNVARCFILDSLLAHIEILEHDRQCQMLSYYLALEHCNCCSACCKERTDIIRTCGTLLSRVDPKAQTVLQDFLDNISIEESLILAHIKEQDIEDSSSYSGDCIGAGSRMVVGLVIPAFLSASSFLQPPVDMLMAAAQLRQAGYEILFIDNRVKRLPTNHLSEILDQADVVVVTTTPYDHIQNYFLDYRLRHALDTVNAIKKRKEDRTIIVCGAHGTVRPDIIFKDTDADIILQWEYDYQIVSVINALFQKDKLREIPNVCLRSEGGEALFSGKEYMHDNLDDGILPAYDLINFNDYYGDVFYQNRLYRKAKWGIVLASRGCRHNCKFCFNFWGQRMRYRDPVSVIEELEYLQLEGLEEIFFIDFHFTQDKHWVSRFCQQYNHRKLTIKWTAQVRCDSVSYDLLSEMALAGCKSLWFGVESFNSCIVQASGKYRDSSVALTALSNCVKAGIEPHQFIMIGLPGETKASINQTISQVYDLKMPYTESILVATPRFGTSYYEMAKRQFPMLGNDFYSLNSVRGIVANDILPVDLQNASLIFRDRDFIYSHKVPQLV